MFSTPASGLIGQSLFRVLGFRVLGFRGLGFSVRALLRGSWVVISGGYINRVSRIKGGITPPITTHEPRSTIKRHLLSFGSTSASSNRPVV